MQILQPNTFHLDYGVLGQSYSLDSYSIQELIFIVKYCPIKSTFGAHVLFFFSKLLEEKNFTSIQNRNILEDAHK